MILKENNKTRQCDNRRLGVDRRQFSYDDYYPERRSGRGRRQDDGEKEDAHVRRKGAKRNYSDCPEM